ncbi:MAG: STAS domain-containing protein [Lentisphaerae bacterium]|nr:STAS domain-containing protein [Lentisphaerota bacterium]
MEIKKKSADGKLVLKPIGRIDTVTAPELAKMVVLDNVKELEFDLSEVDYISSAGLRIFLGSQQKMTASGGKMVLSGVRPIVKEIFDIVGFSDEFTFI